MLSTALVRNKLFDGHEQNLHDSD
jgi:hypothetical protein